MSAKSIMIVGVGGQGTLLASRILGQALLNQGFDIKVSEVHGMSQRGGSVVTYVKYGEKEDFPVVRDCEADLIIAFEQLESVRWINHLKKDGKVIINTQEIDPMPVVIGTMEYPQDLVNSIKQKNISTTALDALSLAIEAGSPKAVNVVLIGVLANIMDFDKSVWIDAVKETVPQKFLDMNLKAFDLGYDYKTI